MDGERLGEPSSVNAFLHVARENGPGMPALPLESELRFRRCLHRRRQVLIGHARLCEREPGVCRICGETGLFQRVRCLCRSTASLGDQPRHREQLAPVDHQLMRRQAEADVGDERLVEPPQRQRHVAEPRGDKAEIVEHLSHQQLGAGIAVQVKSAGKVHHSRRVAPAVDVGDRPIGEDPCLYRLRAASTRTGQRR